MAPVKIGEMTETERKLVDAVSNGNYEFLGLAFQFATAQNLFSQIIRRLAI